MDNADVAGVLEEIAVLLELKGENPFKTRAYINGARVIENLTTPLSSLVKEARLHELKGFGEALQQKVSELVTEGSLKYHQDLKASIPPGWLDMLRVPGLGPKKVRALNQVLQIDDLPALRAACESGKVAELKGFGEKTQQKILDGILFRQKYASHHRLDTALAVGHQIMEAMKQWPQVNRCSEAGSLRRRKETLHDLDFLISSKEPNTVIEAFTSMPWVESVIAKGETKASVVLQGGMQADLRVVEDRSFPFALAYFTGSKEHNIVMRRRAIERGLRLNEYGLFPSDDSDEEKAQEGVHCDDEEGIFRALDLAYIPPELREDCGEFEVATQGRMPRLLEWTDMKGSLHNHSNWSDGRQPLEAIIEDCMEHGFEYWAVTDHSTSSFQANGLKPPRLLDQIKAIRALNEKLSQENIDFRLLTGSEVDILSDGSLDYEDDLLAQLDVVVASIHQGFTQSKDQLTERLIAAAHHPQVHMLGHLSGRLLLERDAYSIDHRAILEACSQTGTWIELNANPYRLDMDWRWWKQARDLGIRCVINCDAHHAEHASFLRLGAEHGRKGWLRAEDVINTLPLDALIEALALKRKKAGLLK